MKILKKIDEVRGEINRVKKENKIIGFVPTMGYLHKGHVSLIKKAKEECDYIVVSIFVNPTQFCPGEDFDRYPRDIERDIKILENEKVDLLFNPDIDEIYKKEHKTWIIVDEISDIYEGKFRPGHFKGVCTVVIKLFNIIEPDKAYFGLKDFQQFIIIKKMVDDLNIPVEIVGCPTIREDDGLAASSRNIYLNEVERKKALCLYKALRKVERMIKEENIFDCEILIKEGRKIIENEEGVEIQYLDVVNMDNMKRIKRIEGKVVIIGAIKIGNVRLIDNLIVSI